VIARVLQPINYTFLPEGIHYIQVLQSSETAVDALFDTMASIIFSADKESTLRFVVDTTRSGALPPGYLIEQVRVRFLKRLIPGMIPYVRVAAVRRKHVTNSLANITVRAINQKRLKMEMFSPNQFDAAIEWLKNV